MNFKQDQSGKKSEAQKVFAQKLAMEIRDSGLADGSSASKLAKLYTIDTLKKALAEVRAGNPVTFNG